jgi:bis(5'-nucleosidyl)-tetraphosphatase
MAMQKIKMSKISKRYIRSAGIIPVKRTSDEWYFLMLRSYSLWDFCKGRIEPGETTFDAAVRETEEEAGIKPSELNFKWGKDYYETEPYRKKKDKIVRYFVAETNAKNVHLPINPELGRPEHHEFRWMTYDEAQRLTNERIGKALSWAYNKITA